MKVLRIPAIWLLAFTLLIWATSDASAAAVRCADVFRNIATQIGEQSDYERDFGAGVFVRKRSNKEYVIEPPLAIVHSAREAQKKVGEKASGSNDHRFTVVFHGFSEGEIIGFKSMLQRDARLQSDENLNAILLETENSVVQAPKDYGEIRERALFVRESLLRRYDWANARVSTELSDSSDRREVYRLTVPQSAGSEGFLLTLRVRAARVIKNRVAQITSLLSAPRLQNATSEQMAHSVIADLKRSDKGITAGTLKVLAADFIIAQAPHE